MCSPIDSELLSQRQVLKDESTSASEERSECGCGRGKYGGHQQILAMRKSPVKSTSLEFSRTTGNPSYPLGGRPFLRGDCELSYFSEKILRNHSRMVFGFTSSQSSSRSLARIIHETLCCGHREHPIFATFSLRVPRRSSTTPSGPSSPRAANLGHSLCPRDEGS